jgi:hypothetical protein
MMDAETLEALNGSIAKWEQRAAGTYITADIENCPLCRLFNRSERSADDCQGCPVFEATETRYCEGTPSEMYYEGPRATQTAKREVEFLKSLLPSVPSEEVQP